MSLLLSILPVAILVAYSQIIVKWRMLTLGVGSIAQDGGVLIKLWHYLTDPYIFSAYAAALIGSFLWLYVVARLPLALAFPVYQGVTFALVVAGSVIILNEPLNWMKVLSIALILIGISIGVRDS